MSHPSKTALPGGERIQSKETKIVKYLMSKGFSPSQVRHICIRMLKLPATKIRVKIHKYMKDDWIDKAEKRFWNEDMAKELKELGLL